MKARTKTLEEACAALKNAKGKKSFAYNTLQSVELFQAVSNAGFLFLGQMEVEELSTRIPGKHFFLFRSEKGQQSRPINKELFPSCQEAQILSDRFFEAIKRCDFSTYESQIITKGCYAATMAFSSAHDLITKKAKARRKKPETKSRNPQLISPGVFFQNLIGLAFSRKLASEPTPAPALPAPPNRIEPPPSKEQLTPDLLFPQGDNQSILHVPVKLSSRERAAEAWLHQRILDGAYGADSFRGIYVVFCETENNEKSKQVTEVCVQNQWKIYQRYVSKMDYIYYCDPPVQYLELSNAFPPINVRPIGEFFVPPTGQ